MLGAYAMLPPPPIYDGCHGIGTPRSSGLVVGSAVSDRRSDRQSGDHGLVGYNGQSLDFKNYAPVPSEILSLGLRCWCGLARCFRMLSGSSNHWVVVRLVWSSSSVRNSCVSGGRMAWVCKLLAQRNELLTSCSRYISHFCVVTMAHRVMLVLLDADLEWLYNVHASVGVVKECYLVDPASSHMLVSKIKPCMFKKLVVGPWVGSTGPPRGVHRSARPFCRRCAPGLNWPGRASGAVTLKKLECSKQAYALDTLAWDNIIGFRSYSVGLRDRSND
ncbi:hypothetical protein QYF36_021343 [Acer negundo]|nr:hypothetical protein QYF36_021343 [Acer negundo]